MLRDRSAFADCLLMVGIFGMASLADTPLADVTKLFKQGRAAEGGCARAAVAEVDVVAEVVWWWRMCGGGCGGCGS